MKLSRLPKLIVILGPTASGKTEIALKLAKKFSGEIISADSRQIYRGMDIGTAKPRQKRVPKTIPHYLIDVINPSQKFSVARYKNLALKAIKDVLRRGKRPFLVGGTGLYIQSVVDNIYFPKVRPNKKLREKLERKTEENLFEIYKNLDPEGAKFIDKKNKRRLIRAIEVCKATGEPFSKQRKKGEPLFDALQIGISLPPEELKKRIGHRVKAMIKAGLEKEIRNLVKKYGFKNYSLQTIGYEEWLPYIKNKPHKPLSKDEKSAVKKAIELNTFKFAKRQMTWFKKDKRICWVKDYKEAENLINNFLR